jgi:hypothetical protein
MGGGRRGEWRKMTFQRRDIKYNSRLEIARLRSQLAGKSLANRRVASVTCHRTQIVE